MRDTPDIVAVTVAPADKCLPNNVNVISSPFSPTLCLLAVMPVYVGTGSKLVSLTVTMSLGCPVNAPLLVDALSLNFNSSEPSVVPSAVNVTVFVAVPFALNVIVNGVVKPPLMSAAKSTLPVASTTIVSPAVMLFACTTNVPVPPSLTLSCFHSAVKPLAYGL